ncbi:MAG: hypothetical protein EBU46_16870 [Nitrosomonadaceae bacterium]|nr:hypothetical protein [Nitrosomonadaceae bacterium]
MFNSESAAIVTILAILKELSLRPAAASGNCCRSPRRGATLAGKRKQYHFLQSNTLDCKK